jgi:hypothetical protein
VATGDAAWLKVLNGLLAHLATAKRVHGDKVVVPPTDARLRTLHGDHRNSSTASAMITMRN